MAVNLTQPVETVISDNSPVAKAQLRQLIEDLISGINGVDPLLTPFYANRAAAVGALASLPTAVPRALVQEGAALVVRSPNASADDPLYPSGRRWGVMLRLDIAAIDAARIKAMSDGGVISLIGLPETNDWDVEIAPLLKEAGFSAGNFSTTTIVAVTPGAVNTGPVRMRVDGGTYGNVYDSAGAVLPANYFTRFRQVLLRRSGSNWRVLAGDVNGLDVIALRTEVALAYVRAGILEMGIAAGSGDAIELTIPQYLTDLGVTIQMIQTANQYPTRIEFFVPSSGFVTNQTGTPTVRIIGGQTINLRDWKGDPLPVGYIKPGNRYVLRRSNTSGWRIYLDTSWTSGGGGGSGPNVVVRSFATDAEAQAFSAANPEAIVFSRQVS